MLLAGTEGSAIAGMSRAIPTRPLVGLACRASVFAIHFTTVYVFALLDIGEGWRLVTGEDISISKHIGITSSRASVNPPTVD